MKAPKALFESTFVHAFEEDGSEGEVYRPEGDAVRRSRGRRARGIESDSGR